jgi:Not1 N-terminal domain, CCR4-Not complex component
MSTVRKLQQDIEKTLKKVYEGIEVFDRIWDKVCSTGVHCCLVGNVFM